MSAKGTTVSNGELSVGGTAGKGAGFTGALTKSPLVETDQDKRVTVAGASPGSISI